MRRRALTLVELLVVIAGVAMLILLAFVLTPRHRPYGAYRASCQSNLKQIGLGWMQYTQDYNERFPRVATGGSAYGWADALQPYLKSTSIYQCPSEPNPTNGAPANPRAASYTDYWFNANLAGRVWSNDPQLGMNLIIIGDGNAGIGSTDARYAKAHFPTAWLLDESSPAYRHLGGMNFGFADGHVKWYAARRLTPNETNAGLRMTVPAYNPPRRHSDGGGRR